MNVSFRKMWLTPVFSTLLANRSEGLVLAGVGGLQLGLHLLGLPGWACPIKSTFGIPCPGCGLTAAMGELLHGKIGAAIYTHAFAPVFLAAFGLILVAVLLPKARREQLASIVARFEQCTGVTAWVLSALMVYWIVRLFGFS